MYLKIRTCPKCSCQKRRHVLLRQRCFGIIPIGNYIWEIRYDICHVLQHRHTCHLLCREALSISQVQVTYTCIVLHGYLSVGMYRQDLQKNILHHPLFFSKFSNRHPRAHASIDCNIRGQVPWSLRFWPWWQIRTNVNNIFPGMQFDRLPIAYDIAGLVCASGIPSSYLPVYMSCT